MSDNPRIEELRRRVQTDPASIAFAALAEEYRRAGRFEEAIATCQAGLQRHPAYLSARVTLGRALIEVGEYDAAREELQRVLKTAPENLAAIRGLADIHHRRGELAEALTQYKSALALARHDPELQETVDQLTRQLSPAVTAAPAEHAEGEPFSPFDLHIASAAASAAPPAPATPVAPVAPIAPAMSLAAATLSASDAPGAAGQTADDARVLQELERFLAAIVDAKTATDSGRSASL